MNWRFDKQALKTAAAMLGVYLAAFAFALFVALLVFLCFADSDLRCLAWAFVIAFTVGLYVLCVTPLVIVAHIAIRKVRSHRLLPLVALPCSVLLFFLASLLASLLFRPRSGWPENPADMRLRHWVGLLVVAALSIGAGMACVMWRKKRASNPSAATTPVEPPPAETKPPTSELPEKQ